jgi:hypothetical protein
LCNEGVKVGLGETVKEEVGDYEIVTPCKRKGQGIAVMDVQSRVGVGTKESKHGDARVDRIGSKVRVVREQLGKKAAVSVAQDQRAATVAELPKKVIAAPFERSTER